MLLHNLSRRLSLSNDFKIKERLFEHLLRPRLDAESSTLNGCCCRYDFTVCHETLSPLQGSASLSLKEIHLLDLLLKSGWCAHFFGSWAVEKNSDPEFSGREHNGLSHLDCDLSIQSSRLRL